MCNQDQLREVVFVEWEHVQAVIERKSEARLKFRGWLYTLMSALFIAAFSNELDLSRWTFLALALLLVILFALKEYIIHIEHLRAIEMEGKLSLLA
jgi:fatty acid desaturase